MKYLLMTIAFIGLITTYYLISPSANQNGNKAETISISDGPYIFKNANQLDVTWICQGTLERLSFPLKRLPFSFNQCDLSANIDSLNYPQEKIQYQGDFPLVALSDLHGQYDLMLTLLKNNKVIDEQHNWNFANGHFVITGDIFDRGDKVIEILWFLFQLEQQALAAGGKIHLLLGNHEVMVLNGDNRYLHPKYLQVEELYNIKHQDLFSKNTVLGAWLRSKNVLVKVNNSLFAHGGFHPHLIEQQLSLDEINHIFKNNLVKSELQKERQELGKFMHKSNGPIWYRGYFIENNGEPKTSSQQIDQLLSHFDVEQIIVGHTSQEQIETRHDGKIIAIDASIKNGHYGELLFINGNKKWVGTLSGKTKALD